MLTRFVMPVAVMIALATAGAAAAAPPSVTTGAASSIGSSTVTVAGTVDPRGLATTWLVEYGTTSAFGSVSTSHSAGNGTTLVDVSQQLTGLQAGTTYFYRFRATNSDGPTVGAGASFRTTGGTTPVATTGAASLIGPFGGTVAGTVDPNGVATNWFVEYGTTTSYGSRTTTRVAGSGTSAIAVTAVLSPLGEGTLYNYRFVAVGGGVTSRGANRTFRTDSAPSVATGSARDIRPTSARLTGTVDPNRRQAVGWFEYGTSTSLGAKTPERTVGGGDSAVSISETVTGLAVGSIVYYRVAGRSGAGTTLGSVRSFRTSAGPTVVTGQVALIQGTEATVSGTVNPNGRATSWWFEWGLTNSYGQRTAVGSAGSATSTVAVTARLTGLPNAATVYVRLVAESSGGRVAGAGTTFRTAMPPGATTGNVTGLAIARATVNGRVDPAGSETSWWFEYGRTSSLGRRTSSGTVQPGTVARVAARLTGLTAGTRYWFRLVVESSGGRFDGKVLSFATAPVPRDPSGRPLRCTMVGTAGPDVLRGTSRKDVICGLGGDDRLYGSNGNDVLAGGHGNDRLEGGAGDDRIFGGSGLDDLIGGNGHDRLDGGSGDDLLLARDGRRDFVVGGPGRDEGILDRVDRAGSVERRRA